MSEQPTAATCDHCSPDCEHDGCACDCHDKDDGAAESSESFYTAMELIDCGR